MNPKQPVAVGCYSKIVQYNVQNPNKNPKQPINILLACDLWYLFHKLAYFSFYHLIKEKSFTQINLVWLGGVDPAHLLVRMTEYHRSLKQNIEMVWIKSGRAQLAARGWSGITCSGRRQPNYKIGAGRQKGACWYLHRFQSINSLSSTLRPVWWLQFNAITSPTDHKF